MTEERFGHTYDISVPGPDLSVCENEEYASALLFMVAYFFSKVAFERVIITVHEDCAGCPCEPASHEANAQKMCDLLRKEIDNDAVMIESYIARRPTTDDFDSWELDRIA